MHSGSDLRLFAISRPLLTLPSIDELISIADPHNPLLWVRGDRGCVGVGEIARLAFTGANRFTEAAAAWGEIHARSTIDDPVQIPGSGLIAFGALAFDDESASQSVLIIPQKILVRDGNTAWITEVSLAPITQMPSMPPPIPHGTWTGIDLPISDDDAGYSAGVLQATAELRAGKAEKIVLARRVTGTIAASDDLRVPLKRLTRRYLDCWTFSIDGMMGASPETLVRRSEGVISARVLAGTRARGATPAADAQAREHLLADRKEQHEHDYAVQSVITALGPYVDHLECDERPFALELPNVWHLATDLRATPTRSGTSLDLAGALHPTAAVAGTPTDTAIESILRIEGFDRERYAGAVGWIDARGDGEWVIALRCAQVGPPPAGMGARAETDTAIATTSDTNCGVEIDTTPAIDNSACLARATRTVTAYAGGGILADSVPEQEFQETISKFRPIREAFLPAD